MQPACAHRMIVVLVIFALPLIVSFGVGAQVAQSAGAQKAESTEKQDTETPTGEGTMEEVALPVEFSVKPRSCVALHKGRDCYQLVRFKWKMSNDALSYCLYQVSNVEPLQCWQGNGMSNYVHRFASSNSEHYQIRREDNDEILAEVKVNTAWVYRTGRRSSSSWRLF